MLKRNFLFAVLLMLPFLSYAQDNMVDLFSGDLNYSVPAIFIPSSNGPGVPLNLQYRSGITMHQKSSWVGLGWNLDIGEIHRDVNGIPDDWVGDQAANSGINVIKKVLDKQTNGTWVDSTSTTEFFGPLYFKNFGTRTSNKEMDVYASNSSGQPFFFPDYDNFVVTAPGVTGIMQPLTMDIATMVKKNAPKTHASAQSPYKWDSPGAEMSMNLIGDNYETTQQTDLGALSECKAFNSTRKIQFRYLNEPGQIAVQNKDNNTYAESVTTQAINDVNGQLQYYKAIGAKNVIFYTKQDIINNTNLDGLIKDATFNYSDANIRATDIVAFKITNEQGYTYHFSLPVLLKNQQTYNMEFESRDAITEKYGISYAKRISITNTPAYISSWKLTAVTGPDFVDFGPTNQISSTDQGYYVKYSYTLWEGAFKWQTPYTDANRNFGEDVEALEQYKQAYPFIKDSPNSLWGEFTDQSNISKGETQVYYLDKIETNTHTAFFVKDLRYDEHSRKQSAGELPVPSLQLKRIILLNNADASTFNSTALLPNTSPAKFTIPTSSASMIHEKKYQDNKTNIDAKTVAAIEFSYDHSLCKNYAANVYNNLAPSTSSINFGGTNTTYNFNYETFNTSASTPINSGKLTLLKITPYGFGGSNSSQMPSMDFQYSGINPDFHPHKKDFWGYYLSDWSSTRLAEYQTNASIANISAWHLSKIATPKGGVIEVEYESDKYNKIGGYDKKITRIFGGKFIPIGGSNTTESFLLDDRGLYDLLQDNTVAAGQVAVAYPCRCDWGVSYYYPPGQNSYKYVFSRSISLKKKVFSTPGDFIKQLDVNNKTKILPPTGSSTFGLVAFCGEGPSYPDLTGVTIADEQIAKASASLTLNYAYGGGVRVKTLKMRETDVNAMSREFITEYTYGAAGDGNGVASQEPGRSTPPMYGHRPVLRDLYDRHANPPAVGYSKVVVKRKGADGNYTDNYYEANFNNYDDWRYGQGQIAVRAQDKTAYDALTNWDSYINCVKNCPEGNTACYNSCATLMTQTYYFIKALRQTGTITARDQSRLFIGKLASTNTYDKNGRIISSSEQEYEKFDATTTMFNQKTHGFIPVAYDPSFFVNALNAPDPVKGRIGQMGPFSGGDIRGVSTLLSTRLFYEKTIQNERIRKNISVKGDVRTVTEFQDFDPITGAPRRILTKDPSSGETVEKEIEFAYTNPSYTALGPKTSNLNNKNMLTLVSLEKNKKAGNLVDGIRRTFTNTPLVRYFDGELALFLSANANTQWVPSKTYVFNDNPDPAQWREDMEYSLYNAKGDPLEYKTTINSSLGQYRYSMVKKGYNDRFVITETNDSRYTESTYSGAEDDEGLTNYYTGEVKIATAANNATTIVDLNYVHTGIKSLKINANGKGFEYKIPCTGLDKTRTYTARVWVYNNSANQNCKLNFEFKHNTTSVIPPGGSGFVSVGTATGFNNQGYSFFGKNWVLLTLTIAIQPVETNDLFVNFQNYSLRVFCENNGTSAVAYFDDFRFHPTSSSMTNYVFNTLTGLPEYSINPDGFYTRNVYDAFGRVYQQFTETPDGEKQNMEINRNFYRFSTSNPFIN